MQPINYGVQIADPTQAFLGAFQTGASVLEARLKQEQQQQQLANQKLIQQGFTKLRQPGATTQDVANLAMILPKDQSESVLKAWALKTDEQKQNALGQAGQVVSALFAGENDIAQQYINNQATAMRNSGNEEGAKFLETWRAVTEVNPTASQNFFTAELLRLPGGDKIVENIVKLQEDRRKQQLQPFTLRTATSEAIIKEAEAKFAPEKFGLEINLTQSQIDQAKAARRASDAAASKSGAEAKRADAEANQISAGIIPADKRPEAEAKFRREYSDQTKGYQDVKSAYGRILAVSDPKTPDEEAAADLALVFNFMKMQDPGSTVNTGEFANAQNAAGVPDRLRNAYNNLITGGRLNPTQRKAFRGQAENLYKVAGQQEDTVRQGVGRIAKSYGLNTENIFYTPTEVAPVALGAPALPTSATVGGKTYPRPASFTDAQWSNYLKANGVIK
jgi:hypothetical protein